MSEEDCISRFFKDDRLNISSRSPLKLTTENIENECHDLSQCSVGSDTDTLSLSQMTIDDQEPLCIQPFYNISPRIVPVSPHYIFEEEFASNPWALVVATIFLTKTSGKTARPYMKAFFQEYPTPYHVLQDTPMSLERFFEKLGLRKRGHTIWKLTHQFVSSKWRRASDLYGIGKYGEDAYRIFCLGHTDLDPGDRYLKLYLDWLHGHTEVSAEQGVVDCEYLMEDPVLKYYRITLRDAD